MFQGAGSKIKVLAQVFFWITVVAGVIAGLALAEDTDGVSLLLIPGALLSGWLSTIVLYAFGELCENMIILNNKVQHLEELCETVKNIEQNLSAVPTGTGAASEQDELPDL